MEGFSNRAMEFLGGAGFGPLSINIQNALDVWNAQNNAQFPGQSQQPSVTADPLYGSPNDYQAPGSLYTPQPITGNPLSGKYGARDTRKKLIESQKQDYLSRFEPLERRLRDEVLGGEQLGLDQARTEDAIKRSFTNVEGQRTRQAGRYGVRATQDLSAGNAQVGALVGGARDTRMRNTDRVTSVMTGAGNIGADARTAASDRT